MNWTQLYQNTPIPTLPKIINSNFTSFEKYIDIFYNGSTGILKVPIETTGRVKGSQGEFVTAIIDNLVVKNQWTNLYDNFTTADYNYYKAYTELAISPRDPCTYGIDTSLWNFPYEPSGYKVIDVNKPYYKITNEYPIFLGNVNLSQVVGIIFDTSIIGGTDFQILIDPCVGTTYDIDASEAGKAYIEFIATSFDASWGSTWEQYKYGVDDPSTQSVGFVGPGTLNYIPIFTSAYKIEDSSLYIDGDKNLQVDASIYQQGKLIGVYDPSLSDSLAMPDAIGGLLADTSVAFLRGNTIDYLFNELLFPTVLAYIETANSALLSGISTSISEVGTSLSPATTGTYNPGDINNGDETNGPNLTGDGNFYTFKLPDDSVDGTYTTAGNSQAHAFSAYNIEFGSNTWDVSISYDADTTAYYDNKSNPGTNLDAQRVAGIKTDDSPIVYGRRYTWWDASSGAAPTTSATIRALPNKQLLGGSNTGTFDIDILIGIKEVFFYIPDDGKTVTVNYEESFDLDVTADFLPATAQAVDDAGSTSQSYLLYAATIPGVGYTENATYRVTIT